MSTETSDCSTFAVIYSLIDRQWVCVADGWTELHLYHDSSDHSYRLVGWTVDDQQIIMNSALGANSRYTAKSADFHKFIDSFGSPFGLGFHGDSIEQANCFLKCVNRAIDRLQHSEIVALSQEQPASIPASESSQTSASAQPAESVDPALNVDTGVSVENLSLDSNSATTLSESASKTLSPLHVRHPSALVAATSVKQRSIFFETQKSALQMGHSFTKADSLKSVDEQSDEKSDKKSDKKSDMPRPVISMQILSSKVPEHAESIVGASNQSLVQIAQTSPNHFAADASSAESPVSEVSKEINVSEVPVESVTSPSTNAPYAFGVNWSNPQHEFNQQTESGLFDCFTVDACESTADLLAAAKNVVNMNVAAPPEHHKAHSRKQSTGIIPIIPPKPAKLSSNQTLAAISEPSSVSRTLHVTYDEATGKWSGLTPELQKALSQQFGLEPMSLETRKLDMYPTRIPRVIIMMREYLINNGGLNTVGIFRLAPDAEENAIVKRLLNNNEFVRCVDINCIANLLKVWFRELPTKLLYGVDVKLFENCRTEAAAAEILTTMEQRNLQQYSLLLWLLDLCVDVAAHRGVNKMTAENLAIVFAPNLFDPDMSDPLAAIQLSQKICQFLQRAIMYRASVRAVAI